MVGKALSDRTRSKKSTNLVNGKIIKSPKKVGTILARSGCTAKVNEEKSGKTEESDIAIIPTSSHESDYSDDDDVELMDEVDVEIDEKSQKRETNGDKNRGTNKGLEENKAIGTLCSELKSEKNNKKGEGKKEGDGDVVLLEEMNTTGAMKKRSNNEGKKEGNNLKGKELKAKSPEKSKKGNGVGKQTEGRKDDKKKVEKRKEYSDNRKNGIFLAEGKNNIRNKKVEEGEKVRTAVKRKNGDENTKQKNKKPREEVEEAKKQMKERGKELKEGAKKDNKQKKVVVGVESKKVKKKKNNIEEEIEREEENNVHYHFPMAQVSRMIKSEEFNSKIAHEAVFVINKATEKFLEVFCREAYACAFLDHRNHVAYNHLASVVSKRRRFDFLSDFVPEKVKAEDALEEMSTAEEETDSETTS